jgi:hypothetical protein
VRSVGGVGPARGRLHLAAGRPELELRRGAPAASAEAAVRGIVLVDASTRAQVPDFTASGFSGWSVRPVRPRAFVHLVMQGKPETLHSGESRSVPQLPSDAVAPQSGRAIRVLLAEDDDVVGKIDPSRLDAMFDPSHHLRHLDEVFERVEAL